MQFLKELMHIAAKQARIDEAKKPKKATDGKLPVALGMVKIPSFISGNMVMSDDDENDDPVEEGKESIKVDVPKARNKRLNDVLSTRKGGRHYDAKKDYVRAKEKSKLFRESADDGMCKWSYEAEYEVKDRSGDGRPDASRHDDGVVTAATAEEAKAKVKAMKKGLYLSVRVSKHA